MRSPGNYSLKERHGCPGQMWIDCEFEMDGVSRGLLVISGDGMSWVAAAPGLPYPERLESAPKCQFFRLKKSAGAFNPAANIKLVDMRPMEGAEFDDDFDEGCVDTRDRFVWLGEYLSFAHFLSC